MIYSTINRKFMNAKLMILWEVHLLQLFSFITTVKVREYNDDKFISKIKLTVKCRRNSKLIKKTLQSAISFYNII